MAQGLEDLFGLSISIALGFLLAVAFYESLSTRDVLVERVMRLTRRLSGRRWVAGLAYALTVIVGIPVLVILWTVVLELFLIAVGSVEGLGNVALVSVSIVAAARILAYARQATAHELAKAIPLAFAFVILTGGALNLEDNVERLIAEPDRARLTDEMITFLVVLEVGLRLLTDGSHAILAEIRRRRGIASDLGVWRTMWIAFRRPIAEALPDPQPSDESPISPGAPPPDEPDD